MADTLIQPTTIARLALATLYNEMLLAGLVWRDFDEAFTGKQGDTITIRKPAVFVANEFNRATGIVLQNATEDSMPLTLDTLADVSLAVTSEELTLDVVDFQNQLLVPAMTAILEKVYGDLAVALIAAAADTDGGGTVTGSGDDAAREALIEAREVLTRNKLPSTDRAAVLSPEATSVALNDELFVAADKSGSTQGLREANIGRLFGFETYETGALGYGAGTPGQADGVAFHKTAVTLASRALQAPMGMSPAQTAVESFQGLTLRVVQSYDEKYKQDIVSVDFLYGIAATRPEGAVAMTSARAPKGAYVAEAAGDALHPAVSQHNKKG